MASLKTGVGANVQLGGVPRSASQILRVPKLRTPVSDGPKLWL